MTCLSSINWIEEVYTLVDTGRKFEQFQSVFLWAVNSAFPLVAKKIHPNRIKNDWYTSELQLLKIKCKNLYHIYVKTKCENVKNEYNRYRRLYKSSIRSAKLEYNSKFIKESKNRTKAAWTIINRHTGKNSKCLETPCKMPNDDINDFFIEQVEQLSKNIPSCKNNYTHYADKLPKTNNTFKFEHFKVEEVYETILKLSNSKCLDIYGLNAYIIKLAAGFICEVLTYLFNCCLDLCFFPEQLKKGKVIPTHKKGNKTMIENYRPISILPVFSKVFEGLLHKQLMQYFECNNLFSQNQYGFRKNRGTCDTVLNLVDGVIKKLEQKQVVSFRSFDMSKAFDTIDHNTLCNKLAYYGVEPSAIETLRSYLSDRIQYVYKNGILSKGRHVKYGVPQGSIMGPILFIIYINDLPLSVTDNKLDSDGYLFADDFGLRVSGKNIEAVSNAVIENTIVVNDWCAANNLSLNNDKTCDITFSFDKRIASRKSVKFLGLHLDTNLDWKSHIDQVASKLSKGLFVLRRLSGIVENSILISVYYAHINSHLSYGIQLWGNSTLATKLFVLQKRALRIIYKSPPMTHCRPLFVKSGILTVPSLYVYSCLLYVKRNLNQFAINSDIHSHNTRQKLNLRVHYHQYSNSMKNWYAMSTRLYNSLPSNVKELAFNNFKNYLREILASNCLYTVEDFFDVF